MARPRKKGREHLPENLTVQVRGGRDYFSYRNPITGKSTSIGYDSQAAIEYAIKANRGIVDPIVDRGSVSAKHAAGELLQYQDILDGATDAMQMPGIYFLLQDDDLVYIGKSIDPEHRIGRHRSGGKIPFNRAMIIRCGTTELSRLEARYIRKYRPAFNATAPLAMDGDAENSEYPFNKF